MAGISHSLYPDKPSHTNSDKLCLGVKLNLKLTTLHLDHSPFDYHFSRYKIRRPLCLWHPSYHLPVPIHEKPSHTQKTPWGCLKAINMHMDGIANSSYTAKSHASGNEQGYTSLARCRWQPSPHPSASVFHWLPCTPAAMKAWLTASTSCRILASTPFFPTARYSTCTWMAPNYDDFPECTALYLYRFALSYAMDFLSNMFFLCYSGRMMLIILNYFATFSPYFVIIEFQNRKHSNAVIVCFATLHRTLGKTCWRVHSTANLSDWMASSVIKSEDGVYIYSICKKFINPLLVETKMNFPPTMPTLQ